jgi:hypothetical protein
VSIQLQKAYTAAERPKNAARIQKRMTFARIYLTSFVSASNTGA